MGRAKYVIPKDEALNVDRWIRSKLGKYEWPCEEEEHDKGMMAEDEFNASSLWCDPVALNAWCEKWLDTAQWNQLKSALRAARKRQSDRAKGKDKYRVDLSSDAQHILQSISYHQGITLSEVIEIYLEDEYKKVWDNP